MRRLVGWGWAIGVVSLPWLLTAETLPYFEGQNLAGKPIVLPDAAKGRIAILVIGFSHASQSPTKDWSGRLTHEFADSSKVTVYSIAALEEVPRLFRGMAAHGIKSGTPEDERSRFLLLYHGEEQLKRAADFSNPDDAYLILLDATGSIRWRFHGPLTDVTFMRVQAEVKGVEAFPGSQGNPH